MLIFTSDTIYVSAHYGHPAQTRANVVHAAEQAGYNRTSPVPSPRDRSWSNSIQGVLRSPLSNRPVPEDAVVIDVEEGAANEDSTAIAPARHSSSHSHGKSHQHKHDSHDESHHQHEDPEATLARNGYGNAPSSPHGHSHGGGSMNMHALLLHVLGDALGNVGVIASGLIIWLSDWKWRFLSDPVISLVITVIIFTSALPLGMMMTLPSCLSIIH